MKIIVDKVENLPPHALTRQDIKAVLSVLPKEWDFLLPIVHLKATLPHNIGFDRPVRYNTLSGSRLTICSRGMSRQEVFKDILRELAMEGLHFYHRRGHRLSQTELDKVDRLIQPLLEQVETALLERQPPAREALKDHYVYRRLEACGYSWKEAYQVVRAIEDEKSNPTSRKTANRINRARQVFLEAGIDPDTMTVNQELNVGSDEGD